LVCTSFAVKHIARTSREKRSLVAP